MKTLDEIGNQSDEVEKPTNLKTNIDCTAVDGLCDELFKDANREKCSVGEFLSQLTACGLRKDDCRLLGTLAKLRAMDAAQSIDDQESFGMSNSFELDRDSFKECLIESAGLVAKTMHNELVIPDWNGFCSHIDDLYRSCKDNTDGEVATYIPQLAKADPNDWGVSICTIDGQRASWGTTNVPFCLQSVSKAFNYAIVHDDIGADKLHSYVGQEPSGRLFNSICLDHDNKPHNPLINAGAIVTCSLMKKDDKSADRFDFALKRYLEFAGNGFMSFDNATWDECYRLLSERDTADRNRALSYFMRENKCFPEGTDIERTLELYFQLCSVQTDCDTAAVMASTFANGGICPLTDERVVETRACRDTMALMYSCGLYDYSGQFAFRVGLPAKSGVSGAMILVIPNVMGICLYSPLLDKLGNSVRGVAFCEEFIKRFNFHNYDNLVHFESGKIDPRRRNMDVRGEQVTSLMFAARTGDLSAIRRHRNAGGSLDVSDYDGRTALHLAAAEGHASIVRFLLDHRADPDPVDRYDRTPLEDARKFNREKCIDLIEEALAKTKLKEGY